MTSTNSDNVASEAVELIATLDGCPCFYEHSLLEAAVTEAARELQVSREMAMMCALGAIATACQAHVDVQMPTGHQVPTSLMLLTIAESGERKTTTQNYFFDAISALNDEAYRANEKALIRHRIDHQLWGTRKRHLERMYSKWAAQEDEAATNAAYEAVSEHLKGEPQPPRSEKFLYEDTTPQALVQMLNENAPNGCLLTSEASSIFSGKALGELDKLNTLWDGGSVIVDRVTRDGFILQDARLTLSLMVQPNVIATFMGKRGEEARGTGFLARFLVAKPRSMAGTRNVGKLSAMPRRQAFNDRIRDRLIWKRSNPRQMLHFSEPAANLWYEYSNFLEKEMQDNGLYYYLKDHASKLLENTSRLAAILHTFERNSESDTEIDLFTLRFCWEFVRTCSRHFIEQIANEPLIVTDTNHLAHFLLKFANKSGTATSAPSTLQERNYRSQRTQDNARPNNLMSGAATKFTLTDVKKFGPSSLRGRANAARLEAAIELLIRLGHVVKEGSHYRFQETVIRRFSDPEPILKNGETITIKELPLFSEQTYWRPTVTRGFADESGYYIVVR